MLPLASEEEPDNPSDISLVSAWTSVLSGVALEKPKREDRISIAAASWPDLIQILHAHSRSSQSHLKKALESQGERMIK